MEKSLSTAFADSLKEESVACIGEYAEIGLDAIMEDGILKDIPIVSTAIALYKIGNSIKERHYLKKLLAFLNEINKGIADEQKRKDYQQKFQSNEKFRNQEIEYLLVLIDRYISYDKPQMLAKLYLAYLDGIIIWEELTMYAEVIDRFLLLDCKTLISDVSAFRTLRDGGADSILRLVALGLMIEDRSVTLSEARKSLKDDSRSASKISNDSKKKKYKRTDFGIKLANILR
jgi:hypothetical protein